MTIRDIESRLIRLEERLAAAAAGEFHAIEIETDDGLAAVELGVNIVMQDLHEEIQRATASEQRLVAKTQELQDKLDQITAQNRLIQEQHQTILELSTPILRLWDRVLVLPIIGSLDTARATHIADRLLATIHGGDVRFAILDLTGLEVVDTNTADQLTRVVAAARLLGVRCVITGVRSEVAQTLVGLGVELSQMPTHRSLERGLMACLQAMFDEEDAAAPKERS